MKWKSLIEKHLEKNPRMKLNPPATEQQIAEIEKRFGIVLPTDLKEFLGELNGDNWLVFSTSQIIEINEMQRTAFDFYMPLDCLLFIAGNGCGDYYGYPITRDGIDGRKIYMWEHEDDSRIYKASGLKDMIEKYFSDQI